MEVDPHDKALSAFVSVRPRLFGIVYRMLGSAVEAEDVVQDVWLRWQAADHSAILDAPAFLATTATRLAINVAQSARSRRETYVGPWLPEPVDTRADPELGAERGEALQFAVLLLLEKLSPTERAAYVLREAFDYPYRQIADILQLEEANVRQLVSRARKHIADERRTPVSSDEQARLLGVLITRRGRETLPHWRNSSRRMSFPTRIGGVRSSSANTSIRTRPRGQIHSRLRLTLLGQALPYSGSKQMAEAPSSSHGARLALH